MKFLLIFRVLIIGSCASDWELLDEPKFQNLMLNETPETMGPILDSRARNAVENIIQQMPCGFPDYGIPPLAPYTNEDLKLELNNSVSDVLVQLQRFRFDGLNEMAIEYLQVSNVLVKKVDFHFTFAELQAIASTCEHDVFLNLQKIGLEIRSVGSGPMEFGLKNLSVKGSFKYRAPLAIGSVQIYESNIVVSLDSVNSNISGILGNGELNALFNKQLEKLIPELINGNQPEITQLIEENVVPYVNGKLEGKKLSDILRILRNLKKKCDPTPAPWLLEI